MTKKINDEGYTCKCGTYHKYPAYVYAHWDISLNHTCDCRRVNVILSGVVRIGDAPKEKYSPAPTSVQDAGRKGGHSKSPNKIKAVRGNLAKANEALAEKRKKGETK